MANSIFASDNTFVSNGTNWFPQSRIERSSPSHHNHHASGNILMVLNLNGFIFVLYWETNGGVIFQSNGNYFDGLEASECQKVSLLDYVDFDSYPNGGSRTLRLNERTYHFEISMLEKVKFYCIKSQAGSLRIYSDFVQFQSDGRLSTMSGRRSICRVEFYSC